MKKNQLIASGTFDLLHGGHKTFIVRSLKISDEVILCITSNSYVKSFKNGKDIEDFEIRKKNVIEFLTSIGAIERVIIISIDDIFGPLLTNKFNPTAIAVTPENEKNAELINKERREIGLSELEIIIIPMDLGGDGKEISSTRIRNGEINRSGRLYVNSNWADKTLILPEALRSELHKPFGKIHESVPFGLVPEKTVTIGDITTQKLNQAKIGQFLSIVDFAVHRQKKFDKLSELGFEKDIKTIKVKNHAATITPELFEAIRNAFKSKNRQVILVEGEEDLAVLPVILIAPLGFVVYYGQPSYAKASEGKPSVGLVEVEITEEIKEKAYEFVSKFDS